MWAGFSERLIFLEFWNLAETPPPAAKSAQKCAPISLGWQPSEIVFPIAQPLGSPGTPPAHSCAPGRQLQEYSTTCPGLLGWLGSIHEDFIKFLSGAPKCSGPGAVERDPVIHGIHTFLGFALGPIWHTLQMYGFHESLDPYGIH